MYLTIGETRLDLSVPRVMGILNVTPDSFSDGGLHAAHEQAVAHALQMLEAGADIIDVGGESTRPGAAEVGVNEELERVLGVIEALRRETRAPVSIDTSKIPVMRAAVTAGAGMVNDVRALRAAGAPDLIAELGVPVCLMHMQGEPGSMQANPHYDDVVADVRKYLCARAAACIAAGIARDNIVLDPGFGFGKTLEHNMALLAHLDELVAAGYPVLAGLSRKSMIPAIMESADVRHVAAAVADRIGGSVTLALYAARKGAHILRVHDVRETIEALTIQAALADAS